MIGSILPAIVRHKETGQKYLAMSTNNEQVSVSPLGFISPISMQNVSDVEVVTPNVHVFYYTIELDLTEFDGGVEDPAAWIQGKNIAIYRYDKVCDRLESLGDFDEEYGADSEKAIREFLVESAGYSEKDVECAVIQKL